MWSNGWRLHGNCRGVWQMNRKTMTAILLIMTMLAVPWAGMLEGPKLQQERGPTWTTTNPVIASQDTMLNSSAENITHGSHYNLNLSKLNDVESYTLFSFPLLQNSTTVSNRLQMFCKRVQQSRFLSIPTGAAWGAWQGGLVGSEVELGIHLCHDPYHRSLSRCPNPRGGLGPGRGIWAG